MQASISQWFTWGIWPLTKNWLATVARWSPTFPKFYFHIKLNHQKAKYLDHIISASKEMSKLNYDLILHSHPLCTRSIQELSISTGLLFLRKTVVEDSDIIYYLSQKGPYNKFHDKSCLGKRSIHIFFYSNNKNYTSQCIFLFTFCC